MSPTRARLTCSSTLLILAACRPQATVSSPVSTSTAQPTLAAIEAVPLSNPFSAISSMHLMDTLDDLTTIQSYSGWRTSASSGEAEALDYLASRIENFGYLNELGLKLERQQFRVLTGTEIRQSELSLAVDGQTVEIPADAMRASRDDPNLARYGKNH